jgi:PQQ-dependent catabolism-associated CXXCW motif protein
MLRLLLVAVLAVSAVAGAANHTDPAPVEYRGWPYKAPTPLQAPGATTLLFAGDVRALIEATDVLLVNVSPITLGPADAYGQRTWIIPRGKPARQIPGSIWLPNVGYQSLQPSMQAYFEDNLRRASGGDKSRPLLFYCTADCWMSWNAAIRARRELGYRNVYWYPYGIDGWKEQEYELGTAVPIPFASESALSVD